jgi:hypothetical protein
MFLRSELRPRPRTNRPHGAPGVINSAHDNEPRLAGSAAFLASIRTSATAKAALYEAAIATPPMSSRSTATVTPYTPFSVAPTAIISWPIRRAWRRFGSGSIFCDKVYCQYHWAQKDGQENYASKYCGRHYLNPPPTKSVCSSCLPKNFRSAQLCTNSRADSVSTACILAEKEDASYGVFNITTDFRGPESSRAHRLKLAYD